MNEPLNTAVAALRAGDVVAIPTDTVYGLAVDPTRPGATDALFALKDRPETLDLPVLVGTMEQADALAGPDGLSPTARRLAQVFWPGPLTIVVARALGAKRDTIGLRLPDHAVARALCDEVGALATTSANLHGDPPCTDAGAVRRVFGSKVVVVDGGHCGGSPSTVVSVFEVLHCLREGAVAWADVEGAARGL